MRVIHRLEVVQVDEQDRQRRVRAPGQRMLETLDEQHAVGETRQIVVQGVVPELTFEASKLGERLAEPVDFERRARVGGQKLDQRHVIAREALQLVDGIGDEHRALEAAGLNDRSGDRLLDPLCTQPLPRLGARRRGQVHALPEPCNRIPDGIGRGIDGAWTSDRTAGLQPRSQGARRLLVREQHELGPAGAEHALGVIQQRGNRVLGVGRLADGARRAGELLDAACALGTAGPPGTLCVRPACHSHSCCIPALL